MKAAHDSAPPRIRSKLFVPCSRPELFDKAFAGAADAISFDLEDAVREEAKDGARQHLVDWLQRASAPPASKLVIVRVNAVDSPHFAADLAACARAGVDWVNLPKVESAAQVLDAESLLHEWERNRGLDARIGLLVNIESPAGLHRAADIASASERVAGLQLGLGDLFVALGIDRSNAYAVAQTRFQVRCAAAQAGVSAYDAACAEVRDETVFARDAQEGKAMGYAGKSCIHPRQVGWANAIFGPSEAQIAQALRLLQARDATENHVRGAFVFEGAMVDAANFRLAQSIFEQAAVNASPPAQALRQGKTSQ